MGEITYFEKAGKENTEKAIGLALNYAKKNGTKKIVVASSTGATALALKEKAPELEIIAVTYGAGQKFKDSIAEWNKSETEIIDKGILIVKGLHALSGVDRSITNKFGGTTYLDIISSTLRILGQGFKVVVEIATMAAEAGLVTPDEDVIVMGGSGRGSDTVVVMNPGYATDIFKTKIKEILCMV